MVGFLGLGQKTGLPMQAASESAVSKKTAEGYTKKQEDLSSRSWLHMSLDC
jgi:hypothetical protein